jgi:hypothetical protein
MKTRWIVILSILAVLVVVRIAAPGFIRNRANQKLENLNGYQGIVDDVDLVLLKGTVIIDSVYFVKTDAAFEDPFMAVGEVEVMIDWNTLFRYGRLMSIVTVNDAEINLLVAWADKDQNKKISQDGKGVDWFETFRQLSPIKFNRIEVNESTVVYRDLTRDPVISTYVDHIEIRGNNLQNPEKLEQKFPGEISISAVTEGGGTVYVTTAINLLKKPMDLDLKMVVESMDLVQMNDFMRVYTGLDFESGVFSLYSDIKVVNGKIDGYVKPVIENLSLFSWANENEPFLDRVWEAVAGAVSKFFVNKREDQLATVVPLSGSIEDPDADILATLWNLFKNAFIGAFSMEISRE